jgi:hypothetical protein
MDFLAPQGSCDSAEAETPNTDSMIYDLEFTKTPDRDMSHHDASHEHQQQAKSDHGNWKRQIKCPLCSENSVEQVISRSQDFPRHCMARHLRKKWPCPSCLSMFTNMQDLRDHYSKHHPGKDLSMEFFPMSGIQKVFACGVRGCTRVFRTPDENGQCGFRYSQYRIDTVSR